MTRISFTIIELLVVIAIIVILCGLLGVNPPLVVAFRLVAGWAFFLWRVVPEIQPDWAGIATGVVCLALLAVGLQWLLGWVHAHRQATAVAQGQPLRRWRFRRTLAALGVVVLMFVAGISAVGVAHQTGWLLNAPEPWVEGGRTAGARMMSANNLKQMALAAHNYLDTHDPKALPPGGLFDSHGRGLHGWQTLLLPYIEEEKLFRQIDLQLPWNHDRNAPPLKTTIRVYLYPMVDQQTNPDGFALSHYAGNAHVLGGDTGRALEDLPHGTSNTVLAGEAMGNYKPWGHPTNWRDPALGVNRSPGGFGSPLKTGANFVMADGSVRFVTNRASAELLQALSEPAAKPAPQK